MYQCIPSDNLCVYRIQAPCVCRIIQGESVKLSGYINEKLLLTHVLVMNDSGKGISRDASQSGGECYCIFQNKFSLKQRCF
jgi:hypothetical protein